MVSMAVRVKYHLNKQQLNVLASRIKICNYSSFRVREFRKKISRNECFKHRYDNFVTKVYICQVQI
jgi:hypothetical protein